jgi:hypothetical protein
MSDQERMDLVAVRLMELYDAFYRIIESLKLLKFPEDTYRFQELILELEFDLSRLNDRITLAKNWRLLAGQHDESAQP